MASDDEDNFLLSFKKRPHEDNDEEDEPLFGEPAPKRAKKAHAVPVALRDVHGNNQHSNDTSIDDIVLFQRGDEMVDENGAQDQTNKRRPADLEGLDTTDWTIADFIRKPVFGADPYRKTASTGGVGAEAAPGRGVTLPVVRSSSGRHAAAEVPPVDTDPALGLYSDDSFTMQVMIGADGRIIVDAATQVIPQAQETEVVHRTEVEGGSRHITSASFRRRVRSEKWTPEEVELLYDALSMCGTDFSMVEVFFPTRTRRHVKLRFKKEEKENPTRVNAALRNRKPINLEEFKKLIAIKKAVEKGAANPEEAAASQTGEAPAEPAVEEHLSAAGPPAESAPPVEPPLSAPTAPEKEPSPPPSIQPSPPPSPEPSPFLDVPSSPPEQPLF